jgi:hypothetical protein
MRWTLRISVFLLLLWAAFMVSPFVALYRLGKAVEAQDVAAIAERVNFQALRLSLSKQIVSEYLRAVGRAQELDQLDRNVATSAGATVAEPLVAQLVTPEAVAGLLNGRLPPGIAAAAPALSTGLSLSVGSLAEASRIYFASQSRGFRNIFIPLPDGKPKAEQVRLHMRLTGATWRLLGLELPQELVRALVSQLPRGMS